MSRKPASVGAAFSPLIMVVVALVAVVAMAGLGVLSAYAPELKTGNDGGTHALSNSSVGYAGIVKLLGATGVPVTLSRGPVGKNADDSLFISTPPMGINPDQVRDRSEAEDPPATGPAAHGRDKRRRKTLVGPTSGHVLIVLPKWATLPEPRHAGWVTTAGTLPPDGVIAVLPEGFRDGLQVARHEGATPVQLTRPDGQRIGRSASIDQLQTLSGPALTSPAWIPVLTDSSGGVIVARRGTSWTYVLSDPDFLNTQGIGTLAGAQNAIAMLDLLRGEDAPVVFDLTLYGFQRTRSLLRLMLEPPLLGVTLVLAALMALAAYQAAIRFGPARETGRSVALGKRALADNTAGLVRLARREHRMAVPYARLVRGRVARAIGAPRTLSDVELDAFLDRVGDVSGTSARYSALADQARGARTANDLMKVASDLRRWKQEMTRGRQ
ncbi:hypothetical protein [Brevundimonas subvibrioides]|uniref:hypothetical protein n=1 Tax=Brevundimonas subvibrioides TaxID=74313 RepID=UPI0022B2DD43|nr:hypothetical protein [Brevundimonas subvibrioides]